MFRTAIFGPFPTCVGDGKKKYKYICFQEEKKIPTEIKIVIDFNRVRVRITEDRHSSK